MSQPVSSAEEEALAKAAQGAAVALLVAFFASLGLAYLTHRLHGGPYIPIVIPALCGAAVGGMIALARLRLDSFDRRIGLAAALLAGVVYVLALQVFIYLRSVDAAETRELLRLAARGDGWWDFIVWTSTDPTGAELSPLGVVGRMLPGPVITVAVIAVELLVTVVAAVRFERRKIETAFARAHEPSFGSRQCLAAGMPDELLLETLKALDAGTMERAAAMLAANPGGGTHGVYIMTTSHGAADSLLEVVEQRADGTQHTRATRRISSWESQTLVDEVRMAQKL